MAIPTSITDLDPNEAMNSPAGSDNVGGSLDNFLRSHAAIIRRQFSKGANVNSASTTILPPDCSFLNVVKVVSTINAFSDSFDGRIIYIKFEGGITLSHSASLVMPGGVDVVTEDDDVAAFINESTSVWRCLSYPRYTDAGYPGDEPASTWPYMLWADTGNMLLKRRNAANTAWDVEGNLFVRPVKTTGDAMTGRLSVSKDNQSGYANSAIVAQTLSTTVGDAAISIVVNGAGAAVFVLTRNDIGSLRLQDDAGALKKLAIADGAAASHAVTKAQLDTKQDAGNYVGTTNATSVTVTWDGTQFQAGSAGVTRGYLWHSGNFNPSGKSSVGALSQQKGPIVEVGPTYFILDINPNQVDLPNPYVMVGMRRPGGTSAVYLRGIAMVSG